MAEFTIIDEHGMFRGTAPDTPIVRDRLGKDGFKVESVQVKLRLWNIPQKKLLSFVMWNYLKYL